MAEKKSEGVKPCEPGHDAEFAMYLTTTYTPHVRDPEIRCVAIHMFLCKKCGHPYSAHQEVPRGYMPDGSISQAMAKELADTRIEAEVQARLRLLIEASVAKNQERSIQGATKAGGEANGTEQGRAPEAGAEQRSDAAAP